MAAGLRLWLLGGFRAEVGGQAVPEQRWHRRKACSLVKLLALAPRHRLHREQLMDILWPDLPPDAAGANLRKAVYFARQAIGAEALRSRDDGVWLEPDGLWVDVDAFQAAIAAGDAVGALGLFHGDLLPEDRFEPWAEERRELFRIQLFRLALRLAAELEQAEELGRASSVLERVVELDALNEEAHLRLARVQAKAGHRQLALRTCLQIQERLREELGERPSAEARRLGDDIAAGRIGPDTESAAGLRPADSAEDLLVAERRLVTVVAVLSALPRRGTADRSCEVFRAWGGSAEHSDDGSIAVFGLPLLHENDASLALSAALEIVGRSPAPVRIGVHTGEVVGQPMPALTGVSGSALLIARRLAEAAKPGTVMVSERTYRSARTQFAFAGPVSVAGPAGEPVRARRMLSRHHAVPEWDVPGDSPFVGRRFDLDAIVALFEDMVATGQPRMVTVVGPAGIGKSRLVREAITAVSRGHPSARILTGRCIATERGMTWWPLAELLHQLCGISLEDSAETAGAKLREGLTSILIRAGFADGELDPVVFALAATAAIAVPGNPLDRCEPTLVADELGRAWPRFLSACSAGAPTLIVIEDLHWAGQQMLEMVERLATRGDGPYLLVGTTRPDLLESRRGFGAGIEGFSTISLRALSDADSATLLRQLPVAQQIPDEVAGEILARSQGNPFFIEQLAFHLAHDPGTPLPDALYAVLAARIDALPIPERRVLQEAAVFGRVFWAAAVSNAVPGIDVVAELRRLERRALVSLHLRSALGDRAEYAFRHVLVRDVAYASLPTARRVRAHAEASSWIEAAAGDRLAEFIELIAFHDVEAAVAEAGAWHDSREYEQIRSRAYIHALQAGSTARRRSAVDNALRLDRQALRLSSGDAERITALTALGDDCQAGFRGDDGRHHYEQALWLARGNPALSTERARLCAKLAYMMAMVPGSFRVSPDPTEVDRLVDEGLAAAGDDEVSQARLLVAKGGSARLWRGSEPFGQGTRPDPSPVSDRIASVHTALEVGQRRGLDGLVTSATAALGVLYGIAGRYGDALAIAERRLARAEDRSRQELVDALRTAAVLTITIKADFETGLQLARRCHALARDAVAHQRMHVTWPLLAALYHLGRWEEMFPIADEHMAAYAQEPAADCLFVRDGPLIAASALAHSGQMEQARSLAAIPGDPAADPDTASAWQAWYLMASGNPAAARAIASPKAPEGRSYGPQYAMVLVEALVALEEWKALDEILPEVRAATAGNALLEPFCDRALGFMNAAYGDRRSARKHLVRALSGFEKFKVQYQAARTRQVIAALTAARGGSSEATLLTRTESSSAIHPDAAGRPPRITSLTTESGPAVVTITDQDNLQDK